MTTVLKAGLDGPFDSQSKTELPEGLSVAGIVAQVCPGLADTDHANLRVLLVSDSDSRVVPSQWWSRIRPRAGVRVVIRLVPRGDDLRTVLLAVVSVAAIYAAPTLATSLFAGTSLAGTALATQLVAVGLTIAGTALVNALVPVKLPSVGGNRAQARYDLSGWSNTERRGEPVPLVLGRHRMAPPLAAPSYSEIVGDDHYIRALFCLGYGPLNISDLRIGDTPLSEFEDVTYELREGRVGDAPVSLYPRQVLEETLGVELVRPLPRDSAGEVIDGDAISTPVTRVTATDSASACVILSFSGGLFKVRDSGDVTTAKVEVRIRQRQAGGVWDTVKTLNVSAATRTGFYRQH
ncbi:MAG: TipJ family phage tail tip protein, partial [Primorskyibacter sp.]